jgi:hypothetical protein
MMKDLISFDLEAKCKQENHKCQTIPKSSFTRDRLSMSRIFLTNFTFSITNFHAKNIKVTLFQQDGIHRDDLMRIMNDIFQVRLYKIPDQITSNEKYILKMYTIRIF